MKRKGPHARAFLQEPLQADLADFHLNRLRLGLL